eukprot:TRINITY_DN33808_c0_g1_i1.p1 TRINITY_DN33808_c0_g1~~TRINITY_DN33808_c0_g1_i1.p1  ORF type:complete len:483 (+),score=50.75 TRINITY_DN33808_c0_g1_i1:141-1451(+)
MIDFVTDYASLDEEPQSPMARWLAEPIAFTLVATENDACVWKHVSETCSSTKDISDSAALLASSADSAKACHVSDATTVPMHAVVPSSSVSTASSSHCSRIDNGLHLDRSASKESNAAKLSTSASRRRRRQKAAIYAALMSQDDACAGAEHVISEESTRIASLERSQMWMMRQRCAELCAQVKVDSGSLQSILSEIRGSVRWLSNDTVGCRLVQDVLEAASRRDAAALVAELRGNVWSAIRSPNGNYVVQKVIEILPGHLVSFVAEELLGYAVETAQHRYGCRVLSRLLEYTSSEPSTVALVDEALTHAAWLSAHSYGHYAIESILEHGQLEQRNRVVRALCSDLPRCVENRNTIYVIRKAFAHCYGADSQRLAEQLTGDSSILRQLADDKCGHQIVMALLQVPGEPQVKARAALRRFEHHWVSSYGRRVLEAARQ